MSIAASRIESFGRDYNLPVADFKSLRDVGVFNEAKANIDDALVSAKNIANQVRDTVIDIKEQANEFMGEATRIAKEGFESIMDLANASENYVKGIIDDVFDGFPKEVIDMVKSVGSSCRNNALGSALTSGLKGPILKNPGCSQFGVGATKCPPSATKGFLGSMAGQVNSWIARGIGAIRKGIQAVASLLSMGFGVNLCNVISSVLEATGIENKGVIGVAVASVMSKEGAKGNLGAIVDAAKSNIKGLTKMVPNVLSNTAKNFSSSITVNSSNAGHIGNTVTGTFADLNSNWNKAVDGVTSIAGLGGKNEGLTKALGYVSKSSSINLTNLNSVNVSEELATVASYAQGIGDKVSNFSKNISNSLSSLSFK